MRFAFNTAALAVLLFLSACSGSGEDVRVTLCKDIVALKHGGAPAWSGVDVKAGGYDPARITLHWGGDGAGAAVCRFDYNAVDDTAMALSDPLSSYSASPSSVTIDGRTLSRRELADAIKDAMIGQGRAAVEAAVRHLR